MTVSELGILNGSHDILATEDAIALGLRMQSAGLITCAQKITQHRDRKTVVCLHKIKVTQKGMLRLAELQNNH